MNSPVGTLNWSAYDIPGMIRNQLHVCTVIRIMFDGHGTAKHNTNDSHYFKSKELVSNCIFVQYKYEYTPKMPSSRGHKSTWTTIYQKHHFHANQKTLLYDDVLDNYC
jgi:hypothetical protein